MIEYCDRFNPGDFIIYRGPYETEMGVVVYNNKEGGTLKILTTLGKTQWVVTSGCELFPVPRKDSKRFGEFEVFN